VAGQARRPCTAVWQDRVRVAGQGRAGLDGRGGHGGMAGQNRAGLGGRVGQGGWSVQGIFAG
jgi:hypothetical protein